MKGDIKLDLGSIRPTKHAAKRMTGRRIGIAAVDAVVAYGRTAYVKGATVHAIGRREVGRYRRNGIDLSAYAGIHVVCASDGAVVTTYRNHDLRGFRSWSRKDSSQ
jgi:hypothetical protein